MRKPVTLVIATILSISLIFGLMVPVTHDSMKKEVVEKETQNDINDLSAYSELLEQETFTQTVYTELEEIKGSKNLSFSPLTSIKVAQSEISYDSVEYWLLNFTYNKIYQSTSHQEDTSGIIQYNLNQPLQQSPHRIFLGLASYSFLSHL